MKEALNTFSDGLVKDYNEMATPSKVMTNCLNGTLITYNGNEFTLQNDMGNAKLKNVKLPAGYVPVGIAEHGGVVYVAAYNPLTKKGQIGSYPSPKQLWSEKDEFFGIGSSLSPEYFIECIVEDKNGNQIPIVKSDSVRIDLFEDEESKDFRIFNVGDLWNVNTEAFPDWLKILIEQGIARLEFNIINASGQTETLDKLTYSDINGNAINGVQIKNSESQTMFQVLNSKSNGKLQLVLRLNSFDTFKLYREYVVDDANKISNVKFTGKVDNEVKYEGLINIEGEPVISTNEEKKPLSLAVNTNGKVEYCIMPICNYLGAIKRLAKEGTINIAKLQEQKSLFTNWSFYVGENNTTIYWSFDYIDVNNETLKSMYVKYYKVWDRMESERLNTDSYAFERIDLQESSYIGDFELVLRGLTKGSIYLVEFHAIKGTGEDTTIATRLLYNVPFYNSWTAADLADKERDKTIRLEVQCESSSKVNPPSVKLYRNKNWRPGVAELEKLSTSNLYSNYIVRQPQDEYEFYTVKEASYTITPNVTIVPSQLHYDGDTYNLQQMLGEFTGFDIANTNAVIDEAPQYSINIEEPINKLKQIENSSAIVEGGNIKVTTRRGIYAPQSEPYEKTLNVEQLMPVYQEEEKDKLFIFKEQDSKISQVAAGRKDQIRYNAIVNLNSTTNASDGMDAELDGNDTGLTTAMNMMGSQSFGLFIGRDNQYASLRIKSIGYDSDGTVSGTKPHYYWYNKDQEVDENDNFMIVTCKDTSGRHVMINLASRKNETYKWGRWNAVYLLKSILSQLLIAKNVSVKEPILAPDANNYIYHTDYDTNVSIQYGLNSEGLDLLTEIKGGELSKIKNYINKNYSQEFTNYLPTFELLTDTTEETISVGKEIYISNNNLDLLPYYNLVLPNITIEMEAFGEQINYMNTNGPGLYKYNDNDVIDASHLRSYIFIGKVASINPSTGVCTLEKHTGGSYMVKSIAGNEEADYAPLFCSELGGLGDMSYRFNSSPQELKLKFWSSFNTSASTLTDYKIGNLNKIFITSIKEAGQQGSPISKDTYNTLLVKHTTDSDLGNCEGKWVQGHDSDAPDMAFCYFGGMSLFPVKVVSKYS